MSVLIIPTRINQTAAEWAVDTTIYEPYKILCTTDEYYQGTVFPKFKFADGANEWSNLDYFTDVYALLQTHEANTSNPHNVTKAQIGLANVTNDAQQKLSEKAQPNGYPSLDGSGKIPSSQLPAIALTDVFVVGSQAAQLALTAEEGDVAVRTDQNKSYIHNGGTSGTMADWQELLTPTDAVISVNGQTGAVTLTTANIADSLNKRYVTDAHLVILGNTSGTNSGNETTQTIGDLINGAGSKTTPVDADQFALMDSEAGNIVKKFSWANLKTAIFNAWASFTATLTNKRITYRVVVVTQAAQPVINSDNADIASITGLAQAITSMSANLTGTPVHGDMLSIEITDNGTARAITWGPSFAASGSLALPTTTVVSTMMSCLFQWNSATSKWVIKAFA